MAGLITWLIMGVNILRELFYLKFLNSLVSGNIIAKVKRDSPIDSELIYYILRTGSTLALASCAQTYIGMYSMEWEGFPTILRIYGEFIVIGLLKDIFSMHFLHQIMHSPKFYSLHKFHHKIKKDTTAINLFFFDTPDLIIENAIGPAIFCFVKHLLGFGTQVHFMAYGLLIFFDQMCHSCNPYTAVYFNPILDFIMKPSINHQLHHILNSGHFALHPVHHFVPALRRADIDQYNSALNTNAVL
jgi:hypothetical protein